MFGQPETSETVAGLVLIKDFVDAGEQAALLEAVDAQPWRSDLKRRVQHYGWVYDYKARRLNAAMKLGPLPAWTEPVAARMKAQGWMRSVDQVIVNEYQPGQGIARHVDVVNSFGATIASLSLDWQVPMKFTRLSDGQSVEIDLPVGSLLVLTGPARYEWAHEIQARMRDVRYGRREPRARRVSLTFRTVNFDET